MKLKNYLKEKGNTGIDLEDKIETLYKNLHSDIKQIKNIIYTNSNQFSTITALENFAQRLKNKHIAEALIKNFVSHIEHTQMYSNLCREELICAEYFSYIRSKIIEYKKPKSRTKQRRIVLLGSTGVGKTTTMFKIVNYFLHKKREQISSDLTSGKNELKFNDKVNVINFDYHKLSTQEVCESISQIMEIQTNTFVKFRDFISHIEKSKQYEIVLVDTPGKNPKNKGELLEMAEYFNSLSIEIEPFLVIPANISDSDAEIALNEFKILRYKAVIVTKLDETIYPNHIISLCVEHDIPIIFLSRDRGYSDSIYETDHEHIFQILSEI